MTMPDPFLAVAIAEQSMRGYPAFKVRPRSRSLACAQIE